MILRASRLYKRKMIGAGNGLFYPIVGFASCLALIYLSFGDVRSNFREEEHQLAFVQGNETRFTLEGKPFYINGWNSYWLMYHGVDEYTRPRVREILQAGAKMGLTLCRTWAFNDGDYNALQISPGQFDERVFKALDHVILEARQQGIRLLLCLVNNLENYGGKSQYVRWAWQEGVDLSASNDSFFFDPSIRNYFKSYIKTILTRKNTLNGIEYRDDPTIFGWELINEPRCSSDASGDTLQNPEGASIILLHTVTGLIEEMSSFVKLIDKKHLLTVGLDGFYGPKDPKALTVKPEMWASRLGSDFIRNSKIPSIDFASVHIYPDHWFHDLEAEDHLKFVSKWMLSHIEDGEKQLNKPVMFTEFGLADQLDRFYQTIYDIIYKSAKKHQAGAGALAWQFIVGGMEKFNDEFGIIPWERPSTYKLIIGHTCRLARIQGPVLEQRNLKELCLHKH